MEWRIGQRLSYEGKRCTVRYFGKIQDKDGLWLGVEWDDETSGKHDGSLKDHRYFSCTSSSPTAASFIRPSRKRDSEVSFVQALLEKYASPSDLGQAIQISGKTVEEIGFEKIQQQTQKFRELKTIILDKRCISFDGAGLSLDRQIADLEDLQLQVIELDLSHNLLETWTGTLRLCACLKLLRKLDVSGNRFSDDCEQVPHDDARNSILPITSLNVEETLLSWKQITNVVEKVPELSDLQLSRNNIARVSTPLRLPYLAELDMSYNSIRSLDDVAHLSALTQLSQLVLRGNPIVTLNCHADIAFTSTRRLDLADTFLTDLTTLDNIPKHFPKLQWLLTKDTPLSKLPSATLITIARVPNLVVLNHVNISSEERQNAEIYYLGAIAKELENATDAEAEAKVLQNHHRWEDLCRIHGTPNVNKPKRDTIDPDTLEGRSTMFTFFLLRSDYQKAHQDHEIRKLARRNNPISYEKPSTVKISSDELEGTETADGGNIVKPSQTPDSPKSTLDGMNETKPPAAPVSEGLHSPHEKDETIEKPAFIPRTTSNYALQGIVGRLFALPPPFTTTIRLFLEFDEWIASGHSSTFASAPKRNKLNVNSLAALDTRSNEEGDEGSDNDSGWSLSQDDDEVYNDVEAWLRRRKEREKEEGKWAKRSLELERSTRGVGDFLSWKGFELGKEARVKVVIVGTT